MPIPTPEPLNSSISNIDNHEDHPQQPSTPPAPQEQQQNEAKLMATKLHTKTFVDTGCLNNVTTEKKNIIVHYTTH